MDSEPKKLALSTDDALRIIETSAKCGVSVLKFQDLEIKFGKQVEPEIALPGDPLTTAPSHPVAEMTDKQRTDQSQRAFEKSELELREEQLAELVITDPQRFEELLNQGELEDDTDDSGDDSE